MIVIIIYNIHINMCLEIQGSLKFDQKNQHSTYRKLVRADQKKKS